MALGKELCFCVLVLTEEVSFGVLDLCVALCFCSLFEFGFEFFLLHVDHAFADFCFLFLASTFCVSGLDVDDLLLFLLLDFVSSVSFSLLRVGDALEVSFLHFEFVLLLGDFEVCGHGGVVGFLLGLGFSNADVAFCIGLGDCCSLADSGGLIHAEVVDNALIVTEVLDVERLDFQAEALEVWVSILLDKFGHTLAVVDQLHEFHLAHDLTHITFEDIRDHFGDVFRFLVQEVLCSRFDAGRFIRHLHTHDGIHTHIDVVAGRNVLGLHVDGEELQAELVGSFQERNLESGMADDGTALAEARNDDDFVGCGLDVGHTEKYEEEQHDDCYSAVKKNIGHIHVYFPLLLIVSDVYIARHGTDRASDATSDFDIARNGGYRAIYIAVDSHVTRRRTDAADISVHDNVWKILDGLQVTADVDPRDALTAFDAAATDDDNIVGFHRDVARHRGFRAVLQGHHDIAIAVRNCDGSVSVKSIYNFYVHITSPLLNR